MFNAEILSEGSEPSTRAFSVESRVRNFFFSRGRQIINPGMGFSVLFQESTGSFFLRLYRLIVPGGGQQAIKTVLAIFLMFPVFLVFLFL